MNFKDIKTLTWLEDFNEMYSSVRVSEFALLWHGLDLERV